MKIVGLTGGIGSGKTTVAKMFASYGVPVYNADIEAKKLMNSSHTIREQLISLLGEETYQNGILNRKYMAGRIFNNPDLLDKANAIIHPKVVANFLQWAKVQTAPYVLKEAAILFESGSFSNCDAVILVTAPREERIKRVMERDQVSREEVLARMNNQWSDEKKRGLSDFIIQNENLSDTHKQVETIHLALL